MRFNKNIKLVELTVTQAANGSFTESKTETDVFCNPLTVGMSSYLAAKAAGLHADASVQVRTSDYNGQEMAVYDGTEYDVEGVNEQGEYTRLTLAKRAHNTSGTTQGASSNV